jgi:CheY-like chemotaxis protein
MKILILEDNPIKLNHIEDLLKQVDLEANKVTTNFSEFISWLNREKYDLIVSDLLVPRFEDEKEHSDITKDLLSNVRDVECINYSTPVLALTAYESAAQENFKNLNTFDICVLTYKPDDNHWQEAFIKKVNSTRPKKCYDFLLFCALEKEAKAYTEIGCDLGTTYETNGLLVQEIKLKSGNGLIVRAPRMGLVNSAIVTTRAIELFNPKLVAMSGICAGIQGKVNIYDVVIPEICHQHDTGKWTDKGFIPELYQVTIDSSLAVKLRAFIADHTFKDAIKSNVTINNSINIQRQCSNCKF